MIKYRLSKIFLIVSFVFMTAKLHSDEFVKEPNVSGQFYPADPKELSKEIEDYTKMAQVKPFDHFVNIIIAPHAGYLYSGPVAAYSFKSVSLNQYKTIVILAPSHFYGFAGISIWPQGAFKTPLGNVAVDEEFTKKLIGADEKFLYDPQAFVKEHSLEVEIPFLQKTFKDFKIVPVILGQPPLETLDKFALKLNEVIGDRRDVLIVASTDLSHYHPDQVARTMDNKAIDAIKKLNAYELLQGDADGSLELCGIIPVTTAILYAKHKGLNAVDLLDYGNSGDATGDKTSVVGYSALAIYAK